MLINKYLLLSAIALSAGLASQAQVAQAQGWTLQHPYPQGNDLLDVSFTDANAGIAVGEAGTIISTGDGGATWTIREVGIREQLRAIEHPDASTAVVVGIHGTILRSTDAGVTWSLIDSGTADHLTALSFVDASTGFALGTGGTLLKTTDGGRTWTSGPGGTGATGCTDLGFVDANTGWVVGINRNSGIGFIRRTTDGGATWTSQSAGSLNALSRVHVFDAENALVIGYGTLLRTTDGGATWTEVASPVLGTGDGDPDNDFNLDAMEFLDASHGYVMGRSFNYQSTVIARTSDGGQTWVDQSPPNLDVFFFGNSETGGIAFGDSDTVTIVRGRGDILRSTDGGSSWTKQLKSVFGDGWGSIYAVHFSDADTGTVVGDSGIGRTTDGGATWVYQDPGLSDREFLSDAFLINADTGCVVGGEYGRRGFVLKTTDGGTTWGRQEVSSQPVRGVFFTDAGHGVIVGDGGFIATTEDTGSTWTTRSSITSQNALFRVAFADARMGIAVGQSTTGSRTVRYTSNGGTNWLSGRLPASIGSLSVILNDVAFPVPGLAIAVGGVGARHLIIRSTDGGATWSILRIGSEGVLRGVHFTDSLRGTAVGSRPLDRPDGPHLPLGSIYRTEDGGETWTLQDSPGVYFLNDVFFVDPNIGKAVGDVGVVLGTTTGGHRAVPQLALGFANGEVVLSWPASFTGFAPQWSDGVGSSGEWSPVSGVPVLVGDRWEYREPANEIPARFYRLFQP